MNRTFTRTSRGRRISLSTIFNKPLAGINESKWKEEIETQNASIIILDIREEILKRVFKECNTRYMEKEVVKFMVDCTFIALKQVISLNFCFHDARERGAASEEPTWIPDIEPKICKPDAWAKGNIIINDEREDKNMPKDFAQQTDKVLSDFYQIIKCSKYPSENVFETTDIVSSEKVDSNPVTSLSAEENVPTESLHSIDESIKYLSEDYIESFKEIVSATRKSTSENMFYKIMKSNKLSSNLINPHLKEIPSWMFIDEIHNELRHIEPGSLRLSVNAAIKSLSKMQMSRILSLMPVKQRTVSKENKNDNGEQR